MLHQFLKKNKKEILVLAEKKNSLLAGSLKSSDTLKAGLSTFLEHLIIFLKAVSTKASEKKLISTASKHGKEMLRLNYSLSQVVHAYGAMCQAITEMAHIKKSNISAKEFNDLNYCLDLAIASAVSEFQFQSSYADEERELQHLGALAHELRNALSSVAVAHDMIKSGLVGAGGSTARVLEENILRMRILIDRSLSDVRMRANPEVIAEKFDLGELIEQILLTAQRDADEKDQTLQYISRKRLEIKTDRQLLLSAIANLVQNAIKYSKPKGTISIEAEVSGKNIVLQVRDECGGVAPDWIDKMFTPFVSATSDRSGLGLGLTIVRRALNLLEGQIQAKNIPGVGCSFTLVFPKTLKPHSSNRKQAVSGTQSIQPTRKESS